MQLPPNGTGVRRRAVLGGVATGVLGASSGCLRRIQSMAGWEGRQQVTLQIKTLPADADPYALRIARTIADWYRAAGIDAQVLPMAEKELLRQVMLNNDFSVFVARGVERFQEPDGLFALLHSRFAGAAGWQNPFGFTDLDVDQYLERQRRLTGPQRRRPLAELQRSIARSQPFTVVAFPDDIRAAQTSRFTNWRNADLRSPYGYLALDRAEGGDGGGSGSESTSTAGTAATSTSRDGDVLRVAVTDRRATENLNPLAVEYRRSGALTGLLYDSLGYPVEDGPARPWMAESWAFSTNGETPTATVRLRPDLEWHDGESLTAEDVAFTYAFLADTSLSTADPTTTAEEPEGTAVPAPRFQGRSRLVADARAVDTDVVEFEFVDCSPRVATRAFTVPVLPEHVWADRTGPASVSGISFGPATEALVTSNIPPVGSGPLQFARNTPREELVLERFGDHFLGRDGVGPVPRGTGDGPDYEELVLRVVGSDSPAIETVASGEADLTGTPVGASTVRRIGRESDLELLVSRADAPYIVGYNARRPPLTNPRFRNTLARLVNQQYLTEEVFGGYARPAVSPLAGTKWVPEDLQWHDGDPVTPFIGSGEHLAVDRAREVFRNAGYQYEDGRLVQNT